MARNQFQTLTEQMYYILLALNHECCGVDIMEQVKSISKSRVSVGPGTLYALLGRFITEGMISETAVEGRKKSYILTEQGKKILKAEHLRLKTQLADGDEFFETAQPVQEKAIHKPETNSSKKELPVYCL